MPHIIIKAKYSFFLHPIRWLRERPARKMLERGLNQRPGKITSNLTFRV